MKEDEQAIRALVQKWFEATKSGDIETVLDMMADDVVFMVPGQEPFGKDEFKKRSLKMKEMKFEGRSEIKEIKILGNWAYIRNFIEMKILPQGESSSPQRSGYTLTIFKKDEKGQWKLARDANLITSAK